MVAERLLLHSSNSSSKAARSTACPAQRCHHNSGSSHAASPTAHAVGGRTETEAASKPSSTGTAESGNPHRKGIEDRLVWWESVGIDATTGATTSRRYSVSEGRSKVALRWAERRRDQAIDRAALSMLSKPTTTGPSARTSWCTRAGSQDPSPKGAGGNGLEAWRKRKSRYDPESRNEPNRSDTECLRPMKIVDTKDLLPALAKWEDEIRKHEEVTGAAMLNKATKKAIVKENGASRTGHAAQDDRRQVNNDRTDEMAGGQQRRSQNAEAANGHVH